MVKRNRKISASLLLGVISLQMVLPFFLSLSVLLVTLLQRKIIKENSSHEGICQQMVISDHDINLVFLNKKEFRYRGIMYDIKNIRKDKGNYIIAAVVDKHETTIQKLHDKHNENTRKQASTHIKSLPFLLLFFEPANSAPKCLAYFEEDIITPYNYNLSPAFTKIITPPPQGRFI